MTRVSSLFGIDADDIDRLADAISQATGIPLHGCHSPMEGRWYSSVSLAELRSLLAAAQPQRAVHARAALTLRPNDPGDAYYGGASHPGKGRFLLEIDARADDARRIEADLIRCGIELITLQRLE